MTTKTYNVTQNRILFLAALRSGYFLKGPIETDDRGRPLDPDAEGFCAVGLADYLFRDPARPGSPFVIREALGITAKQKARIQQEWNDTTLSFPEIANLVETFIFHV